MANIGTTYEIDLENEVVRLYEVEGLSIDKLKVSTGMRERRIRELVKGRVRASSKAPSKATRKPSTPFAKSVEAVYALAIRPQGVRDYEVRNALHAAYGSTWNTRKGDYESNYDKDKIYRVKKRVREIAEERGEQTLFVMDWVNLQAATESREFLEALATNITDLLYEGVNDYMIAHAATPVAVHDGDDVANSKQYRAAFDHVAKLVIKSGKEPVEMLLKRTKEHTDHIDGTSDMPAPTIVEFRDQEPYYPEPIRHDSWLDAISSDLVLSIPVKPAPAWTVPY
ncbi:hypothetical protein BGP82_08865 [Pseudomonas putida]|uniref:Uncharacterized protein n=1 Tax=Pseudomonas putida TaxID=303 RepID=A0A2S3XGD8_PSEPU|nr:hypothetical protein [Pseudomonas putida]POG14523.1 hypothetical protein BGP82_08865 [Pseudomonas putida]